MYAGPDASVYRYDCNSSYKDIIWLIVKEVLTYYSI
nr:MAG TPA: hypothetical protein [Caudoviricetes sp.]